MRRQCGCPEKTPDWDGKEVDLSGQPAHVLPFPTLFHMPLGYEIYRKRQTQEIEQLELQEQWPGLSLMQTGFLRGRLISLLSPNSNSPSHRIQSLPAFTALARLHRGGIGSVRQSLLKMQGELLDKGRMPKELYMAYLTCPHCADQAGGEKILLVRRWETSSRLQARINKR